MLVSPNLILKNTPAATMLKIPKQSWFAQLPCTKWKCRNLFLQSQRAGAGVNNIPVADCTDKGIVVFNTPGANANAVKELVVCGLLLAKP